MKPESESALSVMLIEDNPGDARLILESLKEATSQNFVLVQADRLSTGIARLLEREFDLILLDLSLPDCQRLETLARLREHITHVPVVVLTGLADEAVAVQALQAGAQDYLVKGQIDSQALVRALRYAVERHRLQESMRNLSLTDELTGLRNRRGLLTLAEQYLKVARRNATSAILIFADLDGLKRINDTFGHLEGDRAIVDMARIMKGTCRESDIIARVGGDEFVILTVDYSGDGANVLVERLRRSVEKHNEENRRGYRLSFSTGVVVFDAQRPAALEELIAEADSLLYRNKRSKP